MAALAADELEEEKVRLDLQSCKEAQSGKDAQSMAAISFVSTKTDKVIIRLFDSSYF